MKNKILDLIKSAVWLVLIFIIGAIGFRVSFSLGTPHEKEEFNIKIFTKKGRIRANRIYNRTHLRSKAYDREYYLKNRDKILKYQREYRLSKALGGLTNPNIK